MVKSVTKVLWVIAVVLSVKIAWARIYPGSSTATPSPLAVVQPSPIVAHTVVLQEVMSVPAGGEKKGMIMTTALRTDGAAVDRMDYSTRSFTEAARHIYLPDSKFFVTDEVKGTVRRLVGTRQQREPKQNCVAAADGSRISGTETVIRTLTMAGHQVVEIHSDKGTTWLALDISCAPLRVKHDYVGGWNERRLVSLTVGQPSSELFETDGLRDLPAKPKK